MTILVIEDEPLLLSAIQKKLRTHGITAVAFASGRDGLKFLLEAKVLPDAIWLDYTLPDIDGYTFLEEVRKHKELEEIPVVVVSNSASDEKVTSMEKLGIKQYILKAEHTLEEIIERVVSTVPKP